MVGGRRFKEAETGEQHTSSTCIKTTDTDNSQPPPSSRQSDKEQPQLPSFVIFELIDVLVVIFYAFSLCPNDGTVVHFKYLIQGIAGVLFGWQTIWY